MRCGVSGGGGGGVRCVGGSEGGRKRVRRKGSLRVCAGGPRPADRPAESYGRYGLFLRMENEIYKLRDGAVI